MVLSDFSRVLFITLLAAWPLHAQPLKIVAAENFYGDVAQQIAGSSAEVLSIMSNPNQDPHNFQMNAQTARAVADADIVIQNGLGYDTWMEKLLGVPGKKKRLVITVATLVEAPKGANPHLWYDPQTMFALAAKLAVVLHKPKAGESFVTSMQPLRDKMAALKVKTEGLQVTATEPVFGYMALALGFQMLNEGYQEAIMNDVTPSFQQTVAFEKSLTAKTAKLLFANSQASNPATARMIQLAQKEKIPVIFVTEMQPPAEKTYVAWMLSTLQKIEEALKNLG